MQFISESVIDQKSNEIGEAENFSFFVQSLKTKQPALLAYLFSESFELLTQQEKEYTMFLTLVIWEAVQVVHPEQASIKPKMIEKAEDANWEKLNDSKGKDFRAKLDVFFQDTTQEDLLAFVEDALVHDEDEIISKEGREYVFVSLKTVIDCLIEVA